MATLFTIERELMSTPAKKAVPSLSSLTSDKKDDDVKKDNTSPVVEEKKDDKDDTDTFTPKAEELALAPQASEVVEDGKPVDEQVDQLNNEDGFVNKDGVAFSGNLNSVNKTPADMSSESAAESAKRYGISEDIPDEIAANPNVLVYKDTKNYQIPGGTHLHPDVARDNYNRNIAPLQEHGRVTRVVSENVYAAEAERDDKGIKDLNVNSTGVPGEHTARSDRDDRV
jgi:hypothetical protein